MDRKNPPQRRPPRVITLGFGLRAWRGMLFAELIDDELSVHRASIRCGVCDEGMIDCRPPTSNLDVFAIGRLEGDCPYCHALATVRTVGTLSIVTLAGVTEIVRWTPGS